jgi:hypothetical protein
VSGWIGPTDSARAQDSQKQVLVLFSTGRDAQVSIRSERELPRILNRDLGNSLDYYSEFIDSGRFPDPRTRRPSVALRQKYRGRTFDAVIAMLDVAAEFLVKSRDQLFPVTPVVALASNAVAHLGANSTGVIDRMDYGRTLALARTLQPDIKQVFVVGGAGSRDKVYLTGRGQFRPYEARFRFTCLAGLPTNSRHQLAAAQHSIIFYLLTYQDGADSSSSRWTTWIVSWPSPTSRLSWIDSTMGHGIVGGSMRLLQSRSTPWPLSRSGCCAARRPTTFPVVPDLNVDQIDWPARTLAISEANVQPARRFCFEPSTWDRSRSTFLARWRSCWRRRRSSWDCSCSARDDGTPKT